MLVQVVVGVLAADFLTAAAHWFEDTYLPHTEAPGLLGEIARDNDMHHFIPFSITVGSWWETCRVSAQLMAGLALAFWAMAPRLVARYRTFFVTCAVAMVSANLVHRFQHERECTRPAIVTALQRAGALCSSEQHAVHHENTDVRYGVLLGFTNAAYDSLGVWRALETMLACVGVRPTARKPAVETYKALYDVWLAGNMTRECPEPLTPQHLAEYHRRLTEARRAGLL